MLDAFLNPFLDISEAVGDALVLSSPPLRLAFVGTALRKQVTIVEKTADETFGRHPLVAPFCVTHLQVPGPVPSDAPVQTTTVPLKWTNRSLN